MPEYDFIMAGGGLAGLSLAYHLFKSDLRHCKVLVIDRQPKDRNDRTWCFWSNEATLFDPVVYRSWSQLQFKSETFDRVYELRNYAYKMIRGIDFYRFTRRELSADGNVDFIQGNVDRIEQDTGGVHVSVGNQSYRGKWAFDSRFHPSHFETDRTRYFALRQYFKGYLIDTPRNAFDPQTATLFDFRTDQKGELRFFYVLPFSRQRALIEYVLLSPADYDREIKTYIETMLGIQDYRIVAREGGINPLSDYAFPRRMGSRVLAIGTLGGRIKPTSGYGFLRIQKDSAAIVNSLLRTGRPFNIPSDPRYYRLCDSLMLQLMSQHGSQVKQLFTDLFRNNPIERIFRFLDETTCPWENLALMASLPPRPFLDALLRTSLRTLRITHALPEQEY